MARISVTTFRSDLSAWLDHVRKNPTECLILTARGRDVAAVVTVEDLRHIWNQQDERRVGPINPATGRPFGRVWVSDNFGGHYERERDPLSHLRPRREDAPWLGRPFEWPPDAAVPQAPAAPVAAPREVPAEAPAPPARRWWQVWRR